MTDAGHATDPSDKLVRMANQIATFFRSYPEEEAIAGIHDHIVAFWSSVMRRDLTARADRDPAAIEPLVITALHRIGKAPSPTHKEAEGPGEVGAIDASDAG